MPQFRKKPIVIEARQLNTREDLYDISEWIQKERGSPIGAINGWPDDIEIFLMIYTLEGEMMASKGDWVIRGINGEFYPCKPDVFEKTYERVE